MLRLVAFVLVACLSAHAEDAKPPDDERLKSALRDVGHDVEFVRNEARQFILTVGTPALPMLRARLKQASVARELSRIAGVIGILDLKPRQRETIDSIGPFALSPDGRTVATYESEVSVILRSGDSGQSVDPGEGAVPGRGFGRDWERSAPVFLNPACVAIPTRNRAEIALFEAGSAERCGSLTCEAGGEPDPNGQPFVRVVRLDEKRFLSVGRGSVWIQGPPGEKYRMTTWDLQPRILSVGIRDGGFVALYSQPARRVARWDSKNLKLMRFVDAPLQDADLMDSARNSKLVAIGSSKGNLVALSTSDNMEFGKSLESGLGSEGFSALTVSPDGAWVALGSTEGRVQIRLSTTWEQLAELKPDGRVSQLAFSDDGTTLGVQTESKLHIYEVRRP